MLKEIILKHSRTIALTAFALVASTLDVHGSDEGASSKPYTPPASPHQQIESRNLGGHQVREAIDLNQHQLDERFFYGNSPGLGQHQLEEKQELGGHQVREAIDLNQHQLDEEIFIHDNAYRFQQRHQRENVYIQEYIPPSLPHHKDHEAIYLNQHQRDEIFIYGPSHGLEHHQEDEKADLQLPTIDLSGDINF